MSDYDITNGARVTLRDHDRRLTALEEGKSGPAPILGVRMEGIEQRLKALTWIVGVFTVAFISGVITYIVSTVTP